MDIFNSLKDYLYTKYKYDSYKKNLELYRYEQQIRDQYNFVAQIQLQNALFQVLSNSSLFPLLSKLNYPQDLLPCGYDISEDETKYFYMWSKKSFDTISVSTLHRYTDNMNSLISSEYFKFRIYLQQFDYYTQAELIQMNPLLFNGFHICACKDNNDSIILSAKYN